MQFPYARVLSYHEKTGESDRIFEQTFQCP